MAEDTAGIDRDWTVAPEEEGQRLDVFLARRLDLSRAQTRRLLERGGVRLDGVPAGKEAKGVLVAPGMQVAVGGFVHPRDQRVMAEPDAPLVILAEGEGWLAVDKPAGQPVHPLEPDEAGTLLGAVAARHPEIQGVGEGVLRSGVLHRIDLDTSGALLFATRQETWNTLRGAFSDHRVEKRYHALVAGRPDETGDCELRLAVASHKPARVALARGKGGFRTRLSWRVVEPFGLASLLEVSLETGFLHQIRVSMAHLGHPILGDRVYGGDVADAAPRQMLHCARLAYGEITAESPDPGDFKAQCAQLRAEAGLA